MPTRSSDNTFGFPSVLIVATPLTKSVQTTCHQYHHYSPASRFQPPIITIHRHTHTRAHTLSHTDTKHKAQSTHIHIHTRTHTVNTHIAHTQTHTDTHTHTSTHTRAQSHMYTNTHTSSFGDKHPVPHTATHHPSYTRHYSSYCNTGPAFGNRAVPTDTFGACLLGWDGGDNHNHQCGR
jgi:hypothetical protein